MSVTPSSNIVGVFTDRAASEQAIQALHDAGFEHEHIRYSGPAGSGSFFDDLKSFFTGTNANAHNLANDLTDMGLSNDEVQYYANEYQNGNIILAVNAPGREQEVLDILREHGAYYHTDDQPVVTSYDSEPDNSLTSQYQDPENHMSQADMVAPEHKMDDQHVQSSMADDVHADNPHDSTMTPEYLADDQPAQANTMDPTYTTGDQFAAQSNNGYPLTQENADLTTQTDQFAHVLVSKLQSFQQQLEETRRKLEKEKARLQAAKDHEKQIQVAKEQLQAIQAELEATQAELRETHSRLEQY